MSSHTASLFKFGDLLSLRPAIGAFSSLDLFTPLSLQEHEVDEGHLHHIMSDRPCRQHVDHISTDEILVQFFTVALWPFSLNTFIPFWNPYCEVDKVALRLVYSLITDLIQCSCIIDLTILSFQCFPSKSLSNFWTTGGLGGDGSFGSGYCL